MPWGRDHDDEPAFGRRCFHACAVCQKIIQRKDDLVMTKDGREYCTAHAPEDDDASAA